MRRLTRRQRQAGIVLAVLAAVFLACDVVGASFEQARGGVRGFFGGLYRGTDSVLSPARRWAQALPHLQSDRRTIDRLHARVGELERQKAADQGDARTTDQLKLLQLQATRGGYRILPARVVAIGASGTFDWTVTLDAGRDDGIRAGQTVLAGAALVGRVVWTSNNTAVVLLAADPGSGVGVRNARTGELGVVSGRGLGEFVYTGLDPAKSPRAGDRLLSGPSGSSTYVPGLTVGTVRTVTAVRGGAPRVLVQPATSATALDLLGVVLVGGASGQRPPLQPGGEATGGHR